MPNLNYGKKEADIKVFHSMSLDLAIKQNNGLIIYNGYDKGIENDFTTELTN